MASCPWLSLIHTSMIALWSRHGRGGVAQGLRGVRPVDETENTVQQYDYCTARTLYDRACVTLGLQGAWPVDESG